MNESIGMTPDVARACAAAVNPVMGECILGLYRDAAQPALVELGAHTARSRRARDS